jgi:glycosyltransferase involved in cell wall biosynthesis
VRVFEHERNQGKGAAVLTGLTQARGEFSAIFDADLEYDPADLALLLPPLVSGRVNASFGVRAFDGYSSATRSRSCWATRASRSPATCCSTSTCATS